MNKLTLALLFAAFLSAPLHAGETKQLIYGRVISIAETGLIISCDPAKHSHPTGTYGIADSRERFVHVAGAPQVLRQLGRVGVVWIKPSPQTDDVVALSAIESGEFTYTTVQGASKTVANFVSAEVIPAYSVVTVVDRYATTPQAVTPPQGTPQTPALTMKRSW